MERLNGEKDEGRKARKERSGRACVPDFWSRSMIFPKRTNEGGGLRMAAMELDLAGGEWRIGSHRVGRCGCVFSSLILQPAFLRVLAVFLFPPLSLSAPLFSVSTCLSTYMRDRVISYDRIIPVCAARSLSDFPRCG